MPKKNKSTCIIVSNRLPFQYDKEKDQLVQASGGLVSALGGVKFEGRFMWVGSVPETLDATTWVDLANRDKSLAAYRPVFIDGETYHEYYNGMCNDAIWPILHYQAFIAPYPTANWRAYVKVNQLMADEILKTINEGRLSNPIVWVHDYHLFLLPKILKARKPKLKVGYFLHVPFPSAEIFRQLPCAREVLQSLVSADLVGFQDYGYLRRFCDALLSILGVESSVLTARYRGHSARLGVFPVSIDTQKIVDKARSPEVAKIFQKYQQEKQHDYLILGIDRLDYIKGIELKLLAFEQMLIRHPELKGKVRLLQVAVPSRTDVQNYMELRANIEKLVSKINGEFGDPNYAPIHYMFSSVTFDELIALYQFAEALLVTSKRDGMNIVCFEYIASQLAANPGVVVLSEFAGAVATLSDVLSINPWDIEDTAEKVFTALTMPKEERARRNMRMLSYLEKYNATAWAQTFLRELAEVTPDSQHVAKPAIARKSEIKAAIGTRPLMVVLRDRGLLTQPDVNGICRWARRENPKVIDQICARPNTRVVVLSGFTRAALAPIIDATPAYVTAEYGASVYEPRAGQWQEWIIKETASWREGVQKIMEDYRARTPLSYVEEKDYCLAWHFWDSPTRFAEHQAKRLKVELELGLANMPVQVVRSGKTVEVRPAAADLAGVVMRLASEYCEPEARILVFGDGEKSEAMFAHLKDRVIGVKIGGDISAAPYFLSRNEEIMTLLKALFATPKPRARKSQ